MRSDTSQPTDPAAADATAGAAAPSDAPDHEPVQPDRGPVLMVFGALALLALPLVVAVIAVRKPQWFPLLDLAQTEIRIRDVASDHPPLIGLAGRIGTYGADGGSHPGPLSFWAMWPLYQAFGATSWAMQAGEAVLNIVAVGLSLWIARRRGGTAAVLGVALVLALLMRAYGPALLTFPWNPYIPLLWWFLFLLTVWSLFVDDVVMIPVAVFAGTMAMQTHVSYVGLVGGLTLVATVVVVVRAIQDRRRGGSTRTVVRFGIVGVALAAVLWVPPVIDEIVHEPGNLTTLREHFTDPPEATIGIPGGAELFVQQIDPWRLVTESLTADIQPGDVDGSLGPGLLLFGCWLASAVVSVVRRRDRTLVALHAVIAVAAVLGVVSAARVFGIRFYYLFLWAWSITALMLLAIGWTAAVTIRSRLDAGEIGRWRRWAAAGLAACTVIVVVAFVGNAADADVQAPNQNESLGAITGPTVERLRELAEEGERGPFFITWFPDGWTIGAQGYGLMNELLRRDFDVRAHIVNRPGSTRYHVMEPQEATIELHVATGRGIQRWQTDPRYEEIVFFDPRTAAEEAEFEELRTRVLADLAAIDYEDAQQAVDENLFTLGIDPALPDPTRDRIARMIDLGMPTAVFLGPPSGGA